MVMAIAMLLIAGILVATLGVTSASTTNRSRERVDRVTGTAVADSAITSYELALRSGRASDTTGFYLDAASLQEAVDRGSVVVPNSELEFEDLEDVDPSTPVWARNTVIEPIDDDSNGYWQVYAIRAPMIGSEDVSLAVYFRAWTGSADQKSATRPRMLVARYRSTLIDGYALVTDNQILFTDGTTINGSVHSNGHINPAYETPGNQAFTVWSEGRVSCGANATITTSMGTVHLPTGCDDVQSDQPPISFARLSSSISALADGCGSTSSVRCFLPKSDGSSFAVRVIDDNATVDGVSIQAAHRTLVFFGDVSLSGSSSSRVSVASLQPIDGSGKPGGTITLAGDIGSRTAPLGVYAEKDVIVETEGCPVSQVSAAIVAPNGTLTVDPAAARGRVNAGAGARNHCNSLTITGLAAVRNAPRLRMSFSDNSVIGFDRRTYDLHDSMATLMPPELPLSDGWRFTNRSEANPDCLTSRRGDPACR